MKKFYSFIAAAILTVSLFTSCEKEDDRDAFVGTWNVNETWTISGWGSGTDNYTITISKSSTADNGIIVSSFGDIDVTINATVSGSSVTIPSQTVYYDGDAVNVSGSGSLSGSTLIYNYNIIGLWFATCTATKL